MSFSVQTGIFLLLTSAFLHALWNGFIKKHPHKNETIFVVVVVASLTALAASPWTGGIHFGSTWGLWLTLFAGLCEGGYLIALGKAFEKTSLGLAYTILRGGAMLWVWIISTLFMGETISHRGILGVILIGLGIFLIHPLKKEDLKRRQGAIWSFIGSFFIAGYHLLYGIALDEKVSQGFLFFGSMAVSLPILWTQIPKQTFLKRIPHSGREISTLILAGILSGVSFVLFLFGLPIVGPGYAISLRNTSVAWAQLISIALGEKAGKRQIACVVIITAGAFLLS